MKFVYSIAFLAEFVSFCAMPHGVLAALINGGAAALLLFGALGLLEA